MLTVYLLVTVIVVLALVGLSIAVLIKNNRRVLNRSFAAFGILLSMWILANFVSNDIRQTAEIAKYANYVVFFASYAAMLSLLVFIIALTANERAGQWFRRFLWLFVPIGLLAPTPLVVAGVHIQDRVYAVDFGLLAPLYFVALLGIIAWGVVLLWKARHDSNVERRGRVVILLRSWGLTLPVALLANVILPTTTGWFGLSNIGVLPVLILVVGLYYSVSRHRLFNLSLVLARSAAYIITFGILTVIYGVASFYLSDLLGRRLDNIVVKDIFSVLLIILIMTAYLPTRRIFDRFTRKLFYRDDYDAQAFLEQINTIALASRRSDRLVHDAGEVVRSTFGAVSARVVILGGDHLSKNADSVQGALTEKDLKQLHTMLRPMKHRVIDTERLGGGENRLYEFLTAHRIEVVCRIAPSLKHEGQAAGYVFLGVKRSGNPYTQQDIKNLGIVSSQLAVAVQNTLRFEEIEQFNETLKQRIDSATRELRESNEKLKAIDSSKDDFISMASHQLRTPLTSVKGYLSMVLEGDAGKVPDGQRHMLEQAFTSSQRMTYLISDLLNLSRLKTGKFVILPSRVNLAHLVEQEVNQLRRMAEANGAQLVIELPDKLPDLELDETKMRQVIMNLIDNAIYYTPSGGTITVRLNESAKAVEFTVTDTGIGVPKSEQHKLFSRFYRATNAKKSRPDGTGLGLFMAKKAVAAQGGAIIFHSFEGQGSTFGFSFPKKRP